MKSFRVRLSSTKSRVRLPPSVDGIGPTLYRWLGSREYASFSSSSPGISMRRMPPTFMSATASSNAGMACPAPSLNVYGVSVSLVDSIFLAW